jgi:hypothetical protein
MRSLAACRFQKICVGKGDRFKVEPGTVKSNPVQDGKQSDCRGPTGVRNSADTL